MGDEVKVRLADGCRVLEVIDRRRAMTGDDRIGVAVERQIVDRELRELETERAAGYSHRAR